LKSIICAVARRDCAWLATQLAHEPDPKMPFRGKIFSDRTKSDFLELGGGPIGSFFVFWQKEDWLFTAPKLACVSGGNRSPYNATCFFFCFL
jgi:hypothetical protein